MALHNPLADRALTILTIVLLVDVFVAAPIAESIGGSYIWADLAFIAVLVLGALAIWGDSLVADVFAAAGVASVGLRITAIISPGTTLAIIDASLALFCLALLLYLVGRRVFVGGRVTVHRIFGAVAMYMLFGLAFTQLYRLIALTNEHALTVDVILPKLTYFSFVALTTLGFGDITPIHPLAKSATLLASVIGTLFPAVLIGRLVSLEIIHCESEDPRAAARDEVRRVLGQDTGDRGR
jgi:hypothetical protein